MGKGNGLSGQDLNNIIQAVIFAVVFLTVFAMFFFWNRKQNVDHGTVVEVDPREPHSVTITFVPVMPRDGTRAPAPTPATGLGRGQFARDDGDETRLAPPAA